MEHLQQLAFIQPIVICAIPQLFVWTMGPFSRPFNTLSFLFTVPRTKALFFLFKLYFKWMPEILRRGNRTQFRRPGPAFTQNRASCRDSHYYGVTGQYAVHGLNIWCIIMIFEPLNDARTWLIAGRSFTFKNRYFFFHRANNFKNFPSPPEIDYGTT